MVNADEVQTHNSRSSCWVVIDGHVYDVTEYLDHHPGGANAILRWAGKDATNEYEPVHPKGTVEQTLRQDQQLGPIQGALPSTPEHKRSNDSAQQRPVTVVEDAPSGGPVPLSTIQNLDEFEHEAKKVINRKAWAYYSSAADTLAAYNDNREDWGKAIFRPRILRNVARVSTRRRVMSHDSSLPFFISPAARAKMGHDEGELCLARGAARFNIPYVTSNSSSTAHEDLAKCMQEEQKAGANGGALMFQLYVPVNKPDAKLRITEARRLGFRALLVTVDTAVIGKREEDERYKAEVDLDAGSEVSRTTSVRGDAAILRGHHSSTLDWADLSWIREAWAGTGPVYLKGIQTTEDAILAAEAGVDGIYLSNHGGRQLDYAPSSIRTLLEIRKFRPDLLNRLEIYMDGGVRRGTDVIKALCLGATAVGLGRPFMYALSAYGTEGVCKAIQILSDEIETSMRLMGATSLDQLDEYYVNATRLERELAPRINKL